jgi:outer membrane protein TolC
MLNFSKYISLLFIVGATGCQSYHPVPLDSTSVQRALKPPDERTLQLAAQQLHHPLLQPVQLDFNAGLSPDTAAVLAVLINPSLRAERDKRGLAEAQLFQAGILPNPQVSGNADFVTGGTLTPGLTTGYGLSLSWDVQALIQRGANRSAASSQSQSVSLDVAWKEWQTAESAKLAVYQVAADEAELASAEDVDHRLADNLNVIKTAVNAHIKTAVDLATAESASQVAHDTMLGLQQNLSGHRIALARSLGVPPDTAIRLDTNIVFPSRVEPPSLAELQQGLESRRLDLLGLKRGYDSQEAKVRSAILGQFPKISLGFNAASDTSNVHTVGPAVTIGLPVFDRNQGAIAIERTTRQQLFDEYVNRVFEARSDMAKALADIQSLNDQVAAAEAAVPILERLVETYRIALNERSVDAFSYYAAQNNLDQERIQLLKLKLQLVQNHVALELASGRYLPLPNSSERKSSP